MSILFVACNQAFSLKPLLSFLSNLILPCKLLKFYVGIETRFQILFKGYNVIVVVEWFCVS